VSFHQTQQPRLLDVLGIQYPAEKDRNTDMPVHFCRRSRSQETARSPSQEMEDAMKNPKVAEENHKERHVFLHKNLDELVADFFYHTQTLPTKATIMELIEWSHKQTTNPSVKP
jgi:hypothetical protein